MSFNRNITRGFGKKTQAFNPAREPLYSTKDVAGMFNVTVQTVLHWVEIKHLAPGVKVGGKYYWRASLITELVNGNRPIEEEL